MADNFADACQETASSLKKGQDALGSAGAAIKSKAGAARDGLNDLLGEVSRLETVAQALQEASGHATVVASTGAKVAGGGDKFGNNLVENIAAIIKALSGAQDTMENGAKQFLKGLQQLEAQTKKFQSELTNAADAAKKAASGKAAEAAAMTAR